MVGWRVAAMPGYVHINKKKKILILFFFLIDKNFGVNLSVSDYSGSLFLLGIIGGKEHIEERGGFGALLTGFCL